MSLTAVSDLSPPRARTPRIPLTSAGGSSSPPASSQSLGRSVCLWPSTSTRSWLAPRWRRLWFQGRRILGVPPDGGLVGAAKQHAGARTEQPIGVFSRAIELNAVGAVLDDGHRQTPGAENRHHRFNQRGFPRAAESAAGEGRGGKVLLVHSVSLTLPQPRPWPWPYQYPYPYPRPYPIPIPMRWCSDSHPGCRRCRTGKRSSTGWKPVATHHATHIAARLRRAGRPAPILRRVSTRPPSSLLTAAHNHE